MLRKLVISIVLIVVLIAPMADSASANNIRRGESNGGKSWSWETWTWHYWGSHQSDSTMFEDQISVTGTLVANNVMYSCHRTRENWKIAFCSTSGQWGLPFAARATSVHTFKTLGFADSMFTTFKDF